MVLARDAKYLRCIFLMCAMLVAGGLTICGPRSVFADTAFSHKEPKNVYERFVLTNKPDGLGQNWTCLPGYPNSRSNTSNIGMTWITDSASNTYGFTSQTSSGYNVINVKYGQQFRSVYIWGSIYGCAGSNPYSDNVAVRVAEVGHNYLNLHGTKLNRGRNVHGEFSNPVAPIRADLDTYAAGLENKAGAEVMITIQIYRCYSESSVTIFGPGEACGVSYIPVLLHRDAPPWTASAKSEAKTNQEGKTDWKTGQNAHQNIRPGETVTWRHTVSNTSDTNAPNTITTVVEQASSGLNQAVGGWVNKSTSHNQGGVAHGTIYTTQPTYKITQNDVDKRICQRVGWSPLSGTSEPDTWGYSSEACVTVPYHYPPNNPDDPDDPNGGSDDPGRQPDGGVNIVVSHEGEDTVLPGEDVKFNYTIENQKGPTKTKPIEYHTYTFILPGGNDVPSNWQEMVTYGMNWNNVNCTNGGRDVYGRSHCAQDLNGVTGNINPQDSWTDSSLYNISGSWLGNPGDQICSYIAVDNNWSVKNGISSTSYAASNISCVRIGKRPQIQMNGSDSYAGKGFHSSAYSAISLNINRGSYGQYGLLTGSSAPITNFGSAGYTANASAQTNACKLAFANVGSLTASCSGMAGLGNAGIDHAIAATATIPNGVNANSINSGSISINGLSNGYHRRSGSLTINGGSLGSGVRATIVVNGDVTIAGNIGGSSSESTSYSSLAQVPSLTIIATGNIKVNGSVTLINANLVSTGGKFISCAESSAGNGADGDLGIHEGAMCKNKLKINGSVVSKQSPVLHRTFGSGNGNYINQWDNNTITATSEWFNYTPNVWLTPYLSGGSGTPDGYNTVNVTGLPVRY